MTHDYIVIHHSLTADSGTVSWGAIRKYHMEVENWKDIGYHFGIEDINGRHEILIGRMPDMPGAHCSAARMNDRGIGICIVGNFDLVDPLGEALQQARAVCRFLIRLYAIPRERVIGHREAGLLAGLDWRRGEFKSCPGKLFDMNSFRATL